MISNSVIIAKTGKADEFMKKKGVVGVGVGYKVKDGIKTDKESIVVMVEKKIESVNIKPEDSIPLYAEGFPTDIVETGKLKALGYYERERPAVPGISLGHFDITAGTFGAVVYDASGFPYILSNNHVVANTNDAFKMDHIYQPGPMDGGRVEDTIGYLEKFIPIGFGEKPDEPPDPPPTEYPCSMAEAYASLGNAIARLFKRGTRVMTYFPVANADKPHEVWINYVDCGIVKPSNPDIISPEIKDIGVPIGIVGASLGQAVQKTGRTTGHTVGTVQMIHATVNVDYGKGELARFEEQIVTDDMSNGGDSGSLLLTRFGDPRAVGLLYAGSPVSTIYNPIDFVLDVLGMSVSR